MKRKEMLTLKVLTKKWIKGSKKTLSPFFFIPLLMILSLPSHAAEEGPAPVPAIPAPANHVVMPVPKIDCRRAPGPAANTTICSNLTEDFPVQISFRKMPTWGGFAGLLMIDMCEILDENLAKELKEGKQVVVTPLSKSFLPTTKRRCVRRYCSEDEHEFGFSVDGLPIAIGWVAIRIWLGINHSQFELRCENMDNLGGDLASAADDIIIN